MERAGYWHLLIGLMLLVVSGLTSHAYAQTVQDIAQTVQDIAQARSQGDMQRADELAESLLREAIQQGQTEVQADVLFQQARNAMERNLYPEAQSLLSRAIELYQSLGKQQELGQAYRQLGLTYRYQANYSLALEYIYLAMQIFQQIGDPEFISSTYNSIGVVLDKMGQFEEAAQAHQQALELNHEMGDLQGVASALYNLGSIRRSMGDNELALKYFFDALALDEASGNPKDIAYSHNKIAFLLNIMGRRGEAREHIDKALELFRSIETPRDTDWALTTLAQLELDSGNLIEAQSIIEGVIQRAVDNNYPSLLVDAYEVAARLAYQQERYQQALDYVDAGLAQAQQNKERADEAQLQELQVQILLANDSLKEAFEALQRQKQLDDEILNRQRLDAIAKVQAQTEIVRREHQIELLEKEKALQDVKLEQQRMSRNLWIVAIVSTSVLLFSLYGRFLQRRANRRLEQQVIERTAELEDKNHELARAYDEMEAISLTDKLTGIRNRRFLENHIEADLDQCFRHYQDWRLGKHARPEQSDIVVFICDMDNFKDVNDQYGHNAGDKVLLQFAQRMAKVFRHSDYLVRWGGEEFVAVARFIDRNDAHVLAARLLEAVASQPFEVRSDIRIDLTCSIGYACYPPLQWHEEPVNWHTLVSMADACLYEAKAAGKNTWLGVDSVTDAALLDEEMSHYRLRALAEAGKLKLLAAQRQSAAV